MRGCKKEELPREGVDTKREGLQCEAKRLQDVRIAVADAGLQDGRFSGANVKRPHYNRFRFYRTKNMTPLRIFRRGVMF